MPSNRDEYRVTDRPLRKASIERFVAEEGDMKVIKKAPKQPVKGKKEA